MVSLKVINNVLGLFKDHPELIESFNKFLPRGYKVEVQQSEPGVDISDRLHSNGGITIKLHSPQGTQIIDGCGKASADDISLLG